MHTPWAQIGPNLVFGSFLSFLVKNGFPDLQGLSLECPRNVPGMSPEFGVLARRNYQNVIDFGVQQQAVFDCFH